MIIHDQEPLDFDLYSPDALAPEIESWLINNLGGMQNYLTQPEIRQRWLQRNLAFIRDGITIQDRSILVHSELNSPDLQRYQDLGFVGVYWWSHAIIARDWFRYAQVDPKLENPSGDFELDFNVYCRAWSGSREYRLLVADMIIDQGLVDRCNLRFNHRDQGTHYSAHVFRNPGFRPQHDLDQLSTSTASSTASATYSAQDYHRCWFDVVLETVFDGPRQHLTEKILRPIACAKPFLLASAPGSLQLLRRYGFHTYSSIVDESYDEITDPVERIQALVSSMRRIANMTARERQEAHRVALNIARHNQRHFFSSEFFQQIVREFVVNYQQARSECQQHCRGDNFLEFRKIASRDPALRQRLLGGNPYYSRQDVANLLRLLHQRRNGR